MKFKLNNFIKQKIKNRAKEPPLVIKKNQIYILPTPPGFIFLLVIFVIFAGSFNENNNMGLLFSFFLFFVFLISIRETRNSILGLKIISIKIENSFALSKAKIIFHLSAEKNEKKLFEISCSDKMIKFKSINKNLSVKQEMEIDSIKRGVYNSPVFTLSSDYPYGIFKAWTYIRSNEKQIIYPAPSKNAIPVHELKSIMEEKGIIKDSNKNEDEFKGLKEYEKGDSIKRISWKSYSKGLGLFTKDFGDQTGLDELIIYFDEIKINNIEKKLSLICKTILELESMGLKYGFETDKMNISPGTGKEHQKKCLEILAEFKNE
ncbi:MAG: DUF58 domain-containing protein [Desulfobacteraceae bacterium]|nr:DUF58 domain-containing protein [Desulfobacteraceae bacterium]